MSKNIDIEHDIYEGSASRIGNRIRRIREEREMTRSELGTLVGFDQNRIQQYENGARKPKFNLLKDFAQALGVSSLSLMDPVLTSDIEIMYALFELEEEHGLNLVEINDQIYMMFKNSNPINSYINKWYEVRENIKTRKSSASQKEAKTLEQEYCNWKHNFPELIDMKPTKEDLIREKEAIEIQIKIYQESLNSINNEIIAISESETKEKRRTELLELKNQIDKEISELN